MVEPNLEDVFPGLRGQPYQISSPKHASRQLPDGRWASKLGLSEDIKHALQDLTGTVYGSVVLVMKRPKLSSAEMPEE
jgi:hypothetical protein